MIKLLTNITTASRNGEKTVSVYAHNDEHAAQGVEIRFSVLNEKHVVSVDFEPNQGKVVSCRHTASGIGLVLAEAGTLKDQRFCDVDAPSCDGLKPEGVAEFLSRPE